MIRIRRVSLGSTFAFRTALLPRTDKAEIMIAGKETLFALRLPLVCLRTDSKNCAGKGHFRERRDYTPAVQRHH